MPLIISRPVKLDRYFGKCPVRGCKTRHVVDGAPYINAGGTAVPIFYGGFNGDQLVAAGLFCSDHHEHLKWTQLAGRHNPDKACNGVCMAAVGPSCDCACGGENHGRNHI
ncbi:hypothetical protein SEA_GENGAR_90 [Mycobacterium phage Gengar]|uniref:Uncharacterized protein n=1 Tax=Mycobacterium phage Gengar TaxID=1891963 RepID=A0A1C9EGY3_9CAUD|nr:hypothetical protein SEA_GENGAR_90 [Mycobacterium phage Gengar]AON96745.1 hypothetical protein SEA_GENGAR_90 [Mycobacterium phage Gengar]AOQ28947.1 hypothetical protein SEA_WATERFOUL_90 [Mycobacterium phage Waterfoul]